MTRLNSAFFLLALSTISILLHGYSFSSGDQSTYVPQVVKRTGGNLYARDYLSQTAEVPSGPADFRLVSQT